MLSTIGRLLWVLIAFVLSGIATVFFLVMIGQERIAVILHGEGEEGETVWAALDLLNQAHVLWSGMTLLPVVLIVIVGEVARIRSSLYYIVGGGLALAAIPLLARWSQAEANILPPALVWQVFASAGFLGGWIYWALAGRRA